MVSQEALRAATEKINRINRWLDGAFGWLTPWLVFAAIAVHAVLRAFEVGASR